MGSYETNKHGPYIEKNHDDQSVFISFYIKDIAIIANIVYRTKIFFDVS
jgi:hypothetical protein